MIRKLFAAGTISLAAALSFSAQATVITMGLDTEFSGATAPEGTAPWLTATFDDGGTPGSVTLTLDASALTDAEYVKEWYFNIDPSLTATSLIFSYDAGSTGPNYDVLSLSSDAYTADGVGGDFDILMTFDNSAAGGGANRFDAGEVVVFDITSSEAITAESFSFASVGGSDLWLSAAHVGGIGPNDQDSGWIGGTDDPRQDVPEPGMLALFGAGLLGLAASRRRRQS